MRKRTIALLLAGTFLFGTAAACSDDDNGGNNTNTTQGDSGSGGGGSDSGSGNSDDPVQAYCDAVDDAVSGGGTPSAEDIANLQQQATELGTALATDYTPEELQDAQARLQACITKLATG